MERENQAYHAEPPPSSRHSVPVVHRYSDSLSGYFPQVVQPNFWRSFNSNALKDVLKRCPVCLSLLWHRWLNLLLLEDCSCNFSFGLMQHISCLISQAHQGSVRPVQGLAQQPGAQSMNGGPHLDRNLGRPHYRNQNNRGQMAAPDSASHPALLTLGAKNGLVHTATSVPRHFNTTPNGLPQRRPREHRP